ncbi:hypothetical protein D3C80_577750 [compost metagenome]
MSAALFSMSSFVMAPAKPNIASPVSEAISSDAKDDVAASAIMAVKDRRAAIFILLLLNKARFYPAVLIGIFPEGEHTVTEHN